ncbi:hypothetical protein EDB83DRAFT_2459501 [Lactarius deliciosus]|nr:hypothetical protein EDB83DRAFT_2459501 [Lactarius deliciosus]
MVHSWYTNIVPRHHVGHAYIQSCPLGSRLQSSSKSYDKMDTKSLLVDGYISQTFQSRRAEQYFLDLRKRKYIPPIEIVFYPDREGHFFLVGRQVLEQPTPSLLLDRTVVDRGTVVPQTMWAPHTIADKKQHVKEAVLQMPIFFEGVDGRLGLTLEASAAGRCHGLRNAQHIVPLGQNSTTHVRIAWPGYREFKRQVQIRDETSKHSPISISRFVHHIGRSVDAFLKIGPCGIRRNDIMIIGAIHVSSGSWMPILQLSRYII